MGWALPAYSIMTREPMDRLTLADALDSGKLDGFIIEAEADGMGAAFEGEFAERLELLVNEDRPSPSPARGGSREK